MSVDAIFDRARLRMSQALAAPLPASTAELAAVDSHAGGWCEHCPFVGECVVCGQIHKAAA